MNVKNLKINKIVIDNSVFVKLFLQEADRQNAVDLFCYINENNLKFFVPDTFKAEFLSVIKNKGLSFEEVYNFFENQLNLGLEVVDTDKKILKKALEISNITSKEYPKSPSIYDSIYHSTAIINNAIFITADEEHYKRTKQIGNVICLKDLKFN